MAALISVGFLEEYFIIALRKLFAISFRDIIDVIRDLSHKINVLSRSLISLKDYISCTSSFKELSYHDSWQETLSYCDNNSSQIKELLEGYMIVASLSGVVEKKTWQMKKVAAVTIRLGILRDLYMTNSYRLAPRSAFQAASAKSHEKIVQILIDPGADVNVQGGLHVNALQLHRSTILSNSSAEPPPQHANVKFLKDWPSVSIHPLRVNGWSGMLAPPLFVLFPITAAAEDNESKNAYQTRPHGCIVWAKYIHKGLGDFFRLWADPHTRNTHDKPSPELLLLGCFLCTSFVALAAYKSRNDGYQPHFLVASTITSVIGAAYLAVDVQDLVFRFLFPGVVCGLFISVLFHMTISARHARLEDGGVWNQAVFAPGEKSNKSFGRM